jgi:HEAT repeat protein
MRRSFPIQAIAHVARRAASELPTELEHLLADREPQDATAPSNPTRALRMLLRAFVDGSVPVRAEIVRLLGEFGEPALSLLHHALTLPDQPVQTAALVALRKPGMATQRLVPLLTEMLQRAAEGVRYEVIETLAAWASTSRYAIPPLLAVLIDETAPHAARTRAALALPRIGDAALERLLELLPQAQGSAPAFLCAALAAFGIKAKAAVPQVLQLAESDDLQVRRDACSRW